MKRCFAFILSIALSVSLMGCFSQTHRSEIVATITTEFMTYYKMSDGTWQTEDHSYAYRLEISGRMPNAACDVTFVYLSNFASISFERAWKAAGLSSHKADYFSTEDAVLVAWRTE